VPVANEDWQALLAHASALRRSGRAEEAIDAYQRLLAAKPDLPDSWYNLGWLQRHARRFEEALASYDEALRRGVTGPEEVHLNRAVILSDHMGRPEEAEAELRKALAIAPDYVPALLNLGNVAEDLGRREDARSAYERALAAEPDNMLALARLAGVSDPDEALVGRLKQTLARHGLPVAARADLGFALGRLLDAAGAYGEAFEAYREANVASRSSLGPAGGYDRKAQEELVDQLIAAFPKAAAKSREETDGPLFICGLFRSGSTLAEQILAAHGGITPGGELDLIPTMVDRDLQPYPEAAADLGPESIAQLRSAYLDGLKRMGLDQGLVTDKRPDNFLHIGLIKTLFPGSKIIHTVRDPLDNILSLYFLHLGPRMAYALGLEDAAHWYGQYRRLMAHWNTLYADDIFDLDYDALVREPRPTLQALLAFCGLEWDERCLQFHAAAVPVKTASVWQVRRPLYTSSSGRWRNYDKWIKPLRAALRKLDPA
jgi:tetratricopeptide (TPR) repeat protein